MLSYYPNFFGAIFPDKFSNRVFRQYVDSFTDLQLGGQHDTDRRASKLTGPAVGKQKCYLIDETLCIQRTLKKYAFIIQLFGLSNFPRMKAIHMKYVMGFEPTSVLHDTLESRNSSNFSVPNSRIILCIVLQWIKNRFMQVYIGDGEKKLEQYY